MYRLLQTFADTSLRKRLMTTSVLLLLASTIIPYQFVFVILCVVQIWTSVKVLTLALETVSQIRTGRRVWQLMERLACWREHELLQLYPLTSHAHALDPTHQHPRPSSLGSQP